MFMASRAPGTLDYAEDRFVARFEHDPAALAEVKKLQRSQPSKDDRVWIVEAHGPSVTALVRLALARNWHITAEAGSAARRLKEEEANIEFLVDIVQGNFGEPWFFCKLGNDDELPRQVKAIPAAYIDKSDDSWWVPAYRPESCARLLEIVQGDKRFEVSDAAWRLLEEPDLSYPELSAAPVADTVESDESVIVAKRLDWR
jgi:hypothetical protein